MEQTFQSLQTDMHMANSSTGFAIYSGSYGANAVVPVPIKVLNVSSTAIKFKFGAPAGNLSTSNPIVIDCFLWASSTIAPNGYFSLFSAADDGVDVVFNYGHGEPGQTVLSKDSDDPTPIKWKS
jgi:hypothetical protein